jgi:hypothetical protein
MTANASNIFKNWFISLLRFDEIKNRCARQEISVAVTPQGIAGPGKGPVGIDLAENMVFIGPDQVDRQGGYCI